MTLYNTTGISEKRFSEAECLGDRVGGFIKNHRRTLCLPIQGSTARGDESRLV